VIERGTALGRGIAFSTTEEGHVLNVRAEAMGGFPDRIGDFVAWLEATGRPADPKAYVPRAVYGDYLEALAQPPLAAGALEVVRGTCIGLSETADGVVAELEGGRTLVGDYAAVATGNEGPLLDDAAQSGWDRNRAAIAPDAAVLIKGTGLTMVDQVIALGRIGHRGRVIAVSRRGLVPRPHVEPAAPPASLAPPLGAPLSATLRWVRAEILRNGDWRAVIDGLRPHSHALWQAWNAAEKRRFSRHLRPYWDVHRHRGAPAPVAVVEAARASGRLRVVAARLDPVREEDVGLVVGFRHRGSGAAETVIVDHVIDCSGAAVDPARVGNPLIASLLRGGFARADDSGVGLAVGDLGALIGADGTPSERLFALGPVARARYWESIAIAEIRAQCAALARRLTAAAPAEP